MHFTLLKSVLQPYSVLLFSHVLISILMYCWAFKQMYSPCVSFIWAQGEGAVVVHVILVLLIHTRWLLPVCFIIFGLGIHFKWGFICEKFCALFPELRFCPSRNDLLLFLTDTMEILSVWDPYVGVLSLEIFKQLLSVNFKRANLFLHPPSWACSAG